MSNSTGKGWVIEAPYNHYINYSDSSQAVAIELLSNHGILATIMTNLLANIQQSGIILAASVNIFISVDDLSNPSKVRFSLIISGSELLSRLENNDLLMQTLSNSIDALIKSLFFNFNNIETRTYKNDYDFNGFQQKVNPADDNDIVGIYGSIVVNSTGDLSDQRFYRPFNINNNTHITVSTRKDSFGFAIQQPTLVPIHNGYIGAPNGAPNISDPFNSLPFPTWGLPYKDKDFD